MKRIIIILSIQCCLGIMCFAQSITPQLISSGGSIPITGDVKVHWAIGEVAVQTHENGIILSEGFYQAQNLFTSINDSDLQFDINVYPNPAVSDINIECDDIESLTMEVINVLGSHISTISALSDRVDISFLPAGAYLLRFVDREGKYAIHKLIKI